MKKILIIITAILFISACNNNMQGTSTPAPTETAAPATAAPTAAPTAATPPDGTEKPHNTGSDDPLIEYFTDENEEIELIQIAESFALTNAYFGVTYVMPESWYVWFMDDENLNEDPDVTRDINDMNIDVDPKTNESFIDFFEIGSNHDEALNDHLSVGARAVYLDGKTLDAYLENYKETSLRSENVSLAFEGEIEINGVTYKRLVFFILNPIDNYDSRIMDTFSFERNGYMVMVRFDGWASCPDNENELITYMYYFVMVEER